MKFNLKFSQVPLLVFFILAALVFSSCGDSESPPVDTGPDRTTPDNLLLAFAKAYREKDLDAYDECLHEDFLFHFTPEIADSLGLPAENPWWGKTEDVQSTSAMFESPNVTVIVFTYEYQVPWYAYVEERIGWAEEGPDTVRYSGLTCRLNPLIEVTTVVESEDPILKLRVDSSWLDVMVVPDPHTEGLWSILSIRETKKWLLEPPIVSAIAATESNTWGGIKAIFY